MSKFKKGDYVTPEISKDYYVDGALYCIEHGDMGKIVIVRNNEVIVRFNDFMEVTYYENQLEPYTPSDAQLIISLAKLRDVLNEELKHHILPSKIDKIINRIKQEL